MFIKIYPNEIYLCYDCYKINLLCVILWFKKSNQEDPLSNLHLKLARWSRGEYSNWKCDKIGFWIQYRLNIWLKWRSLIDILIRNKIYLCIVCLGRFNGAPSIFQLRIMFDFITFVIISSHTDFLIRIWIEFVIVVVWYVGHIFRSIIECDWIINVTDFVIKVIKKLLLWHGIASIFIIWRWTHVR